jgi:succinyl-CoA synthetase beta subunit
MNVVKRRLGDTFVIKQMVTKGKGVNKAYIADLVEFVREYYIAILIDRNVRRPLFIISTEGGVNIEEMADKSPEMMQTIVFDPISGLHIHQIAKIVCTMNLEPEPGHELANLLLCLYKLFVSKDFSLVEINPFALTKDVHFLAIDSTVSFDDNALIRHPDIVKLRDSGEEDPREVEASMHSLNYVSLDENIACLVNGLGLAIATMDLIMYYGSEPANFWTSGEEQMKNKLSVYLTFF